MTNRIIDSASTVAAALAGLMALALPVAPAVASDQPVRFGTPTVLSQQGQRLKVVVPVRATSDERLTAVSFNVVETEVPQGFQPLPARSFTVMRPQTSDYVMFQSDAPVAAPEVAVLITVAGDPRSPYRMDLYVPAATASAAPTEADRTARAGATPMRRLRGPAGRTDLPPK